MQKKESLCSDIFLGDKQLDRTVPIPLYFQLKELVLNEIKERGSHPYGGGAERAVWNQQNNGAPGNCGVGQ